MSSIKLKAVGKEVDFYDSVSMDFSIEKILRPESSWGFGVLQNPDTLTFFDAFDLDGDGTGFFEVSDATNYGGWAYGYGYEYTEVIREAQPTDILDVTLDISPAAVYEVFLNISGPGQLHLYYNSSTFGYDTTFQDGTNHLSYKALTDAAGELSFKISVPYSFEETQWFQEFLVDNESKAHIYTPRGGGMVTVTASVMNKWLDHPNLRSTGTLIESESQVKIKSTGALGN